MGVAAYQRGNAVIARQFDDARQSVAFEVMDRLNRARRHPDARVPWGPIHFVPGHGGAWAECPKTGFGYWYPTLLEALSCWRVVITELRGDVWVGIPEQEAA